MPHQTLQPLFELLHQMRAMIERLDDIDYAGTIGAFNIAGAFPEYKANLRVGYRIGPVDLNYNLQYLGEMDNQGNLPDFGGTGAFQGVSRTLFHDLSARWDIK